MLLLYLVCAGAFALGWILRGALCLRPGGCDSHAADEIARLEARVLDLEALRQLPPTQQTQDWARRQGLLP